jgi:hypothetical protein
MRANFLVTLNGAGYLKGVPGVGTRV